MTSLLGLLRGEYTPIRGRAASAVHEGAHGRQRTVLLLLVREKDMHNAQVPEKV